MSKALTALLIAASLSLAGCASAPSAPAVDEELAAALALRDSQLAELAETLGIADPPVVDLVAWVTPEESRDAWVGCLVDAGVTAAAAGVADIQYDPADAEALWACRAAYTLDPRVARPLGSDKLSIVYRYYVDVQVPCLESRGFTIEEAEPESRFKPHYYTDHGWVPYRSVPAEDVTADLLAACPVNAPFEDVYGERLELPAN